MPLGRYSKLYAKQRFLRIFSENPARICKESENSEIGRSRMSG